MITNWVSMTGEHIARLQKSDATSRAHKDLVNLQIVPIYLTVII